MGEQSTNYQCPHCLGPLHFSSETGKLQCDYCGSCFTVEQMKKLNQEAIEKEGPSAEEQQTQARENGWGDRKMRLYSCPSCGAELISDETTAATCCPYCGNPTIVPGQFHGALCPEYIIPFRLDQEDAEEALRRHYKKKFLLPSVFSKENQIQKVQGVYIPFWMFDGKISAEISYHCTNSSTHREGNYRVTNTRHYYVQRCGSMQFSKVPVDGSKKMNDDLMDSLEPYDYEDLKPFSTAYLPGYLAHKYDVNSHKARERAEIRCKNSTESFLRGTVNGYSSVTESGKLMDAQNVTAHYSMLPVWLLNTKWHGKNYLFAMNGQTGKIVGDLPCDPVKKRLLFWGVTAAVTLTVGFLYGGQLGSFLTRLLAALFL